MTNIADTSFQESLQGLANWLTYLEMKRSMYSQQLERARKQSPGTDNAQTGGNGAAAQSVFSDMAALKAPTAAAQVASDRIPPDDLGDSWLTMGDAQPAADPAVMTPWREDDPEMAAWDVDDGGDSIEDDAWAIAGEVINGIQPRSAENGDTEEQTGLMPDEAWALTGDDDPPPPDDESEDGEESDELPPSWL